jgi:hypothetical protein
MRFIRAILGRLRALILRLLKADHSKLDQWLSLDSVRIVEANYKAHTPDLVRRLRDVDERKAMENLYLSCQKQSGLSGFELRFTLYYFLGRDRQLWE